MLAAKRAAAYLPRSARSHCALLNRTELHSHNTNGEE
jgi:hypothetical protein